MKLSHILCITLIIVGLGGALLSSAFFFGFFTVGIFLILYDLTRKGEEPLPNQISQMQQQHDATSSLQTCINCGALLDASAAFCPKCGGKVIR